MQVISFGSMPQAVSATRMVHLADLFCFSCKIFEDTKIDQTTNSILWSYINHYCWTDSKFVFNLLDI